MGRLGIRHKCVTVARETARRESMAKKTGWSVFVKRYYGKYRLIGVQVTEKQRECRNLFAEAQRLAKAELEKWNRKRHWEREARRHKVKGAHRMAVKWWYRAVKEERDRKGEECEVGDMSMMMAGRRERREMESSKMYYICPIKIRNNQNGIEPLRYYTLFGIRPTAQRSLVA